MRQRGILAAAAAALAAVLLLAGGCSRFNCTPLEAVLGGDVNLVRLGHTIAADLAARSMPPLRPMDPRQPVVVLTFVHNKDLAKGTDFGRTLQEHVAAGFVQMGYTVRELKLRRDLLVEDQNGEFMLSRRLDLLSDRQRAQAVVVGTYSLANRVLYLSARLVQPGDGRILAAYDDRFCLDEGTLRMLGLAFEEADPIRPPRPSLLNRILY